MFYQMATSESLQLNFYSKYSLARDKKNIASLYDLIPQHNNNTKSTTQLNFKLTVCRQNKYDCKDKSQKEYSNKELLESFSYLRFLHEQQKQQILRYGEEQLKRYASLTQFQMSKARSRLKQRASQIHSNQVATNHQNQSNKQKHQQKQSKSFASSKAQQGAKVIDLQQLKLHQSILGQNSLSDLSFQQDNEQKSLSQRKLQPSVPLQPQIQSKVSSQFLPSSCINKDAQVQHPDKVGNNDLSYDQKDFIDAFASPIKQSVIVVADQERKTQRKNRIQSLKHILMDLSQQNEDKQAANLSQFVITSIVSNIIQNGKAEVEAKVEDKQIKNITNEELEPIKSKKMNFKAIMKKNGGQGVKIERNKKLLLNFFDQN